MLRLAARACTNREIAAELKISLKTVETHKSNGMRRLGLTDRRALLRYALEQGWLADL